MTFVAGAGRRAGTLLAPMLLFAGCSSPEVTATASRTAPAAPPASTPALPAPAEAPQPLVEVERPPERDSPMAFATAALFKPRSQPGREWLTDLAPLIVEAVPDGTPLPAMDQFFGAVVLNDRNMFDVDWKRPTVLVDLREVPHEGCTYRQLFFGWVYSWSRTRVVARSISVTLAPDGFPCVWQVRGSQNADALVVYVSESFEARCQARFGSALPNRQFSAERDSADEAGAPIADLIEDGPMPMGPYVYLHANTHKLATLACRCSPSVVESIDETHYYDLKPKHADGLHWRSVAPNEWPFPEPWDVLRWPYDPDSDPCEAATAP